MRILETVRLGSLMAATEGAPIIAVGLLDGPVLTSHQGMQPEQVRVLSGPSTGNQPDNAASAHGTFIAGILHARRGGAAPGLCPGCELLVRPIFHPGDGPGGGSSVDDTLPSCAPESLAQGIIDCVRSGARLLNLSVGLTHCRPEGELVLNRALDFAASSGVLVVVAAGNQGSLGGSVLVSHCAVIPVAACDSEGRISQFSNIGNSIGRRGLAAPGQEIESLASGGGSRRYSGTSAAVPFVTGVAALLWSLYPAASAMRIKQALMLPSTQRRRSIVPPLLDAQASWQSLVAG